MRFQNPFLHWIDWFYSLFVKGGENLKSLFLLYMRLTWGHQFFVTGLSKLHNIEHTAAFFAKLHFAHPVFLAYLVGWVEFLGGLCLVLGFASRIAAIPLAIAMLAALSTAHAPEISELRFLTQPMSLVIQEPYPFLVTAILALVFGPGRISVDALLKRWAHTQPKY